MKTILATSFLLLFPIAGEAQERMKFWCFGLGVQRCVSDPLPRTTITVCPRISQWSPAFQQRLAAARRKANDPDISEAIREAVNLRDQARACREVPK